MNLVKGSLQDELDYFFKAIHAEDVSIRTVTKSAFSKARKKLHYKVFIELSRNLAPFFYEHFPCRTWKGFRILAIDGSTIKVPRTKDCASHFGVWNSSQGEACPLARISSLFDVLSPSLTQLKNTLVNTARHGRKLFVLALHSRNLHSNDQFLNTSGGSGNTQGVVKVL